MTASTRTQLRRGCPLRDIKASPSPILETKPEFHTPVYPINTRGGGVVGELGKAVRAAEGFADLARRTENDGYVQLNAAQADLSILSSRRHRLAELIPGGQAACDRWREMAREARRDPSTDNPQHRAQMEAHIQRMEGLRDRLYEALSDLRGSLDKVQEAVYG